MIIDVALASLARRAVLFLVHTGVNAVMVALCCELRAGAEPPT